MLQRKSNWWRHFLRFLWICEGQQHHPGLLDLGNILVYFEHHLEL